MARPPVLPINQEQDYFDKFIDEISPYFKNSNIPLDFNGYKETVELYSTLNANEGSKAWELSRDFNMWSEYFSQLKALCEKYFLDSEVDEKEIFSNASSLADVKSVSNGDRLANKDSEVVSSRKIKNNLKAFSTLLDSEIDFSNKAHHHCKNLCQMLNAMQQCQPK